jgi:hypothetical protein
VLVGAGALTGGWPVTVLEAEGGSGAWLVSDAIELVCAPPVLCTTPVGGSGVADESADDELPVAVDDVDETVVNDGEFEPDGAVSDDDELEGGLDELSLSVDVEGDEVDVLESDGSASATPGMVATAEPTPSAIANAPTRPTKLT